MRDRFSFLVLVTAVFFGLAGSGCGLLKVKGKGHVKVKHGDKTYEKKVEFDSLEELPAAMKEMGTALAETTDILVTELVDVPPPGEVMLADLDPALAQFEQNPRINFLLAAKNQEQPMSFKYVQVGMPSYDQFFKKSSEFFALAYQTKQTIHNMRNRASTMLQEEPALTGQLKASVDKALANSNTMLGGGAQAKNLSNLASVATLLAGSARAMVTKTQELVAAGQQLIAAAPSSITNPKTVIHLNLIVKGLGESVAVIGESGKLLTELVPELAGF